MKVIFIFKIILKFLYCLNFQKCMRLKIIIFKNFIFVNKISNHLKLTNYFNFYLTKINLNFNLLKYNISINFNHINML